MKQTRLPLFLSVTLLVAGVSAALFLGAASFADPEVLRILRLPRAIVALGVGGGLAVAGVGVQAVLANPLADPYTLGIASSAACGAIAMGHFTSSTAASALAAFFVALSYLTVLLAWAVRRIRDQRELILTGVIAGFFFSSLATLLLAYSDPTRWTASFTWILGSIRAVDTPTAVAGAMTLAFLSSLQWMLWKPLDLMAVDGDLAHTAGVPVDRIRILTLALTSVITAVAVSFAGIVGFVGLLVPHTLRALGAHGHRTLIPLSFIAGGGLLALADGLARALPGATEPPVGIMLSLAGCPLFLWLLRRSK
jgi:iron complex transport system permease protein